MIQRSRPFLLIVAMAIAFFLIYRVQAEIDKRRGPYEPGESDIYFQNPDLLRRLSLGYESLLADVYWIRAIQYYGRKPKPQETKTYNLLHPMLDLATSLDSEMTTVYRFGSMFLSEPQPLGPGQPLQAIALLDKGIKANPGTWRFYFDKGFVYLWHLKDYKAAGQCFLEGSRQPEAPKWLGSLAAAALGDGGELETARTLWTREFEEAENESVRNNARNHLNSLKMDEERWQLEFLAVKYQEKTGRALTHLDQLVTAGFIRFVPDDPSGVPYEYDRDLKGVYPGRKSTATYFPLKPDARNAYWARLEQQWQAGR